MAYGASMLFANLADTVAIEEAQCDQVEDIGGLVCGVEGEGPDVAAIGNVDGCEAEDSERGVR